MTLSVRRLEEEHLDTLPGDSMEALRLHSEIERYNTLLGNYTWFLQATEKYLQPGDRLIEIAAGRGELIRRLIKYRRLEKCSLIHAMDAFASAPEDLPVEVSWHKAFVEDFDYSRFNVLLACHILHQLDDVALRNLGDQLGHFRCLIVCETLRNGWALALCRLSRFIGFSQVAVDDGLKSIRGGFQDSELPAKLGLQSSDWTIKVSQGLPGYYRLIAMRKT